MNLEHVLDIYEPYLSTNGIQNWEFRFCNDWNIEPQQEYDPDYWASPQTLETLEIK